MPDAIRDVVRGRLAALPERATAELQVAAVLGERFDLRTAMAASERDPDSCLDALDAAIVTRILVPEGDGFRFAHALVRDAVLSDCRRCARRACTTEPPKRSSPRAAKAPTRPSRSRIIDSRLRR